MCIRVEAPACSPAGGSTEHFIFGGYQQRMKCAAASVYYRTVWAVGLWSVGLGLSLTAAEPGSESPASSTLPPAYGMSDAVTPPKTELKQGDKAFVEKAANLGAEELALSRIAVERATNPQVREFAQLLVSEHTKSNEELMTIVESKGAMRPAANIKMDKWEKKKAKQFDKEYIEAMVNGHKEAAELYDKQAKHGDDADLMNFAGKNVPVLNAHLAKAQGLRKMLK